MTSWKTIAATAVALALVAGAAQAETGVSAATRALGSCLSALSGPFPDPLKPGEAVAPAPEDRIGQELIKSGDPVTRLPSDFGQVYVVRPKDQCVVDTFNLDADALTAAAGDLLSKAPYNAGASQANASVPGVRMWVVRTDSGALNVAVATIDPTANRTIIMIAHETVGQ